MTLSTPRSSAFTAGDTADAPNSSNPALLAALASDLHRVGYTVDGVGELLGGSAHAALGRDQLVPAIVAAERAARGTDAGQAVLAAVVGLWLLAIPQPPEMIDAALPSVRTEGLVELGLAEIDDDGAVTARADLRPYGWDANADGSGGAELWVASDLAAHQRPGVLRHDHVLGIGQASTTLVQTTIRRPAERALDLGTGCGIQTFHLLHHAQHVTATDISVRALAFTRFNLLLNAAALHLGPEDLEARVSLRLGSLLEPVAGERFDLVVSNPPFVITPRNATETAEDQFTYRDGGLAGDDIVATLVRQLPDVLTPGGTAQLLGNWEIPAGSPWSRRPESWLQRTVPERTVPEGTVPEGTGPERTVPERTVPEGTVPEGTVSDRRVEAKPDSGSGTDAWFIQREQLGPEQYAETWLQDASENRDRAHYVQTYQAYLDDFASRDVEAIGFGMIWLRRARGNGGRIRRFEEITYPIEQPIGPHLGAAVDRADWLAVNSLEDAHLVVADDVTEERHQRPGAEHPGVILLRQGAGLRRTNLLSTELAGFVSACDGELSVNQIIGALVALLGGGEAFDADAFRSALLAEVGNLVADGFLLPAGLTA